MKIVKHSGDITKQGEELLASIAEKQRVIKAMTDELDAEKAILLEAMQEKELKNLKSSIVSITYVESSTKMVFDSKALKEEAPKIYEKYQKKSQVKASLRITFL